MSWRVCTHTPPEARAQEVQGTFFPENWLQYLCFQDIGRATCTASVVMPGKAYYVQGTLGPGERWPEHEMPAHVRPAVTASVALWQRASCNTRHPAR